MPNAVDALILTAVSAEFGLIRTLLRDAARHGGPIRAVTGRFHDESAVLVQMGVGPTRAAAGAGWALAEFQPRRALLIGYSGGLDPDLPAGAVVLASAIRSPDGPAFPVEPEPGWTSAARVGPIVSVDRLVTTPTEKAELFRRSGALAVDMESASVARTLAGRAPLTALRAVSDPADAALPAELLSAVGPEGDLRPWTLAKRLLGRPGLALELRRLQRDVARAAAGLRAVLRIPTSPRSG